MTDYTVNVFDDGAEPTLIMRFKFKVKHFRQWKGRQVDTYGGYTAIFHQETGMVFSSKCRDDEQFSRRKGLLTCIQKAVSCPPFFGAEDPPVDYNWITGWKFSENHVDVYLCKLDSNYRWSWLTKRL
jgi:hypothetical protein